MKKKRFDDSPEAQYKATRYTPLRPTDDKNLITEAEEPIVFFLYVPLLGQ
jgi:hypothetical protein